jgi:hypothetical protein
MLFPRSASLHVRLAVFFAANSFYTHFDRPVPEMFKKNLAAAPA